MKINIYVYMNGVQTVYGGNDNVEIISQVGYFRGRPAQQNVIDFIKLINKDERFNVAILSAVFDDGHSKKEKIADHREWTGRRGCDIHALWCKQS